MIFKNWSNYTTLENKLQKQEIPTLNSFIRCVKLRRVVVVAENLVTLNELLLMLFSTKMQRTTHVMFVYNFEAHEVPLYTFYYQLRDQ